MRRHLFILLASLPTAALAQVEEVDYYEPEQAAESAARSAQADANFDSVMLPQSAPMQKARRQISFDETLLQSSTSGGTSEVEVSLREFHRVRDRLNELREEAARNLGPAVVLGAAEYSGEAREGALALTLTLQVTLGQPDRWKIVPLVGDDAVVIRASAAGVDVPIARRNGYHVWVTERTGEISLRVEILVPARGPRGSIEYDFLVARTPVTKFSCRFPVPGLEPRLTAAVHSETRSGPASTQYTATLRPTTRIHLVGFRDLGAAEGRDAKIYAETTSLLSVDEGAFDLFTVIRYTILYAGTKDFAIQIPKGMTVVSADGRGAFQFTIESEGERTVLKGETAFPIRNNYEISLRLRQEIEAEAFDLRLPTCIGVEREQGWLGVEVTGKLKLEELTREELLAVDLRQLPVEMIQGAVSPILKAYRYNVPDPRLRLEAILLPEKEPASASIDKVRAFTVVSTDGQVLTDLRVTLRNRLRHSLTLTLPAGTEVRTTLLDGDPVKPSRKDDGRLMVPLKRSTGRERLEPFTVQVVLAGAVSSMGLLGRRELDLPSVDLPVSSLAWSVFLPARNLYSALEGDIEHQEIAGTAAWHPPSRRTALWQNQGLGNVLANAPAGDLIGNRGSLDTGAMPVRIKLPERGTRVEYNRYWLDADKPLAVSFWYLRGWVRLPIALALVLGLAACLVAFSFRWPAPSPGWTWAALGGAVVLLFPVVEVAGSTALVLGLLLGAAGAVWRLGWLRGVWGRLRGWVSETPARFRERDKLTWTVGLVFWRLALGSGMFVFAIVLLVSLARVISLLWSPLPG